MSKLQFDQEGQRFYETGVDHGVLFVKNQGSDLVKYFYATSATDAVRLTLKEVDTLPQPFTKEDTKFLYKVNSTYTVVLANVDSGAVVYVPFTVQNVNDVSALPAELTVGNAYAVESESPYANGVAWNGLISVTQSPEGAEAEDIYADNIKYLTLISNETFGGTITAYTYPDEFNECDGNTSVNGISIGQQTRTAFALAYRTIKSNDNGDEKHKLHFIYGAKAAPSEREYSTVNDSPEAMELSWEINTTPVVVDDVTVNGKAVKPISHIEIDEVANPEAYAYFEEIVLGSADAESRLPLPDEILALIAD